MIASLDYDIILGGGFKVQMAAAMKEAAEWGLDPNKIVLDRTVCVPGFTLERYQLLRQSRLSIFSLICWGGLVSNLMGMQFFSPTVNMYFEPPDFMKFLRNPHHYLEQTPVYVGQHKKGWPIFNLGDITLQMSHYRNAGTETAFNDWVRRAPKVNWDNILVMMFTQDPKMLAEFDALPYAKKVCFTYLESDLPSAFHIPPKFRNAKLLWTVANNTARNTVQCFDMWDMLLYGKNTPVNR